MSISDKDAVALFEKEKQATKPRCAVKQATKTVVRPVEVIQANGATAVEIRPFVRMGQYYTPERVRQADSIDREYSALNKAYRDTLKSSGQVTEIKEAQNPLKFEPLAIQ